MKTTQPAVSVIIPVYKAEPYLHRCLNSLKAQTLQNYEVLLINDGSPDNSGEICDNYASEDVRFKAFHNKNQGVSATRQFGITHAQGKYSIHIDPDDWVEPTMLEELFTKAEAENADMVIFDFIAEYRNRKKYCKQEPTEMSAKTVLKEMFYSLHASCCNKLIRHECYKRYNVNFPQGFSCFEDLYVITSLLCNHIKVAYIPKAFYHYDKFSNPNSIIKNYTQKSYEEDMRMFAAFQEHSNKLGEHKQICLETLAIHVVARAFNSGIFSGKEFQNNFKVLLPYIENTSKLKPFRKWKFTTACKGYYSLIFLPQRIAKYIKLLFRNK